MCHAAFLLLSSGVCRIWEQELGVGGSIISCKKKWELGELGSSIKPLLSGDARCGGGESLQWELKANTSCIFETTLGTGLVETFIPYLRKCFSQL